MQILNYENYKKYNKKFILDDIIDKDKASNYKNFSDDKDVLSKINIENNNLVELINYSYQMYPRTYLFEKNNCKLTDQQLLSILRKISNIEKININMKIKELFILTQSILIKLIHQTLLLLCF